MTTRSNKKPAVDANKRKIVGYSGSAVLFVILLGILVYLQASLWIGEGSLAEVWRLKQSIEKLETENKALKERNQKLISEVEALRNGLDLIEHRAREDLGLIKDGEIFYHVIENPPEEQ